MQWFLELDFCHALDVGVPLGETESTILLHIIFCSEVFKGAAMDEPHIDQGCFLRRLPETQRLCSFAGLGKVDASVARAACLQTSWQYQTLNTYSLVSRLVWMKCEHCRTYGKVDMLLNLAVLIPSPLFTKRLGWWSCILSFRQPSLRHLARGLRWMRPREWQIAIYNNDIQDRNGITTFKMVYLEW